MYHDVPFAVESIEQIERDLPEARRYNPFVRRIFLLNGDAFSLDYETLSAIGEKAIQIFPEVEAIASYATITGIAKKSDEELQNLRKLRFNGMNIGSSRVTRRPLNCLKKATMPTRPRRSCLG